jgi:hypothetical protein
MVKVYAVALAAGILLLLVWIGARALAANVPAWAGLDPEGRFGRGGRVVVATLTGFGLAGLSAEFSPRSLPWPVALGLALVGAGLAGWYVLRVPGGE